jgi:diguanylate cyclase (GGDEF)-like protein
MDIANSPNGTLILIPALWICTGVLLYMSVQAAVMGFAGSRVPLYLTFSLMCLCAAGYQLSLAEYYRAPSAAVAANALQWQSAFISMFHPALFGFVALYTGQRRVKPWLIAVAATFAGVFVVNLASPYSLRFSTLQADGVLRLPWGETLARFRGEASIWNGLARLADWAVLGWAIVRTAVLFRCGERRAATFLAVCVALLAAASVQGAMIDWGMIDSFYTAGFAFLAFTVLMSFSMSIELRERTADLEATTVDLHKEVEQRQRIEQAIKHIAAGVSSETGHLFFRRLATELASLFQADCAFIGVLDKRQPRLVNTLAVCLHGELVDNMVYSLEHTPCANVVGKSTCVYPQGVHRLFPEDRMLREMGAECYIGSPLFDAAGQPLGLIVVLDSKPVQDAAIVINILDIFAARAAGEIQRVHDEQQIHRMAYHDDLTGLPNRALFHEHLSEAVERAGRSGEFGAMLLIDLDHFKTINDALSHFVGDEVLCEVGRLLITATAGRAFVARLGGDEFVAVMSQRSTSPQESAFAARRLAEAVAEELSRPLAVGERILNVGASIGIAPFPHYGSTPLDILRQADMALYRAKSLGRGTIQFYVPSMQEAVDERLKLEKGLREALKNDEFTLHFQPQLDLGGRMVGVEALLRWCDPKIGNIPPSSFIPAAEESGLIHAVGTWVLDQACDRLTRWMRAGVQELGGLSVNVSPWQFTRPDFVQQVDDILTRRGADPHRLTLEITETALLYDLGETVEKLNALREMGLTISLDDFGTGYSSLAHLKRLPFDELKIDRSFVTDLAAGTDRALVQSIIVLGQHMKIRVVAEGVESSLQRDVLVEMGCEYFQGYLFCRPLAEQDFLHWLAENRAGRRRLSDISADEKGF